MAVSIIENSNKTHSTLIVGPSPMNASIQCTKNGYIAQISILNGEDVALSASAIIGTLPDAYKPIIETQFIDVYGHKRIVIDTDGKVYPRESTTTFIRGSVTYITATCGG